MKLALNGLAHYPDFNDGYRLYLKRAKKDNVLGEKTYRKVIKEYCKLLVEEIEDNGTADLPSGLGTITAAIITRKPQYRGDKFIGYGKMDWKLGHYDGKLKTFGLVYLPRHNKNASLRCFGFVANRRLFKRMKSIYDNQEKDWKPIDFNDKMI